MRVQLRGLVRVTAEPLLLVLLAVVLLVVQQTPVLLVLTLQAAAKQGRPWSKQTLQQQQHSRWECSGGVLGCVVLAAGGCTFKPELDVSLAVFQRA